MYYLLKVREEYDQFMIIATEEPPHYVKVVSLFRDGREIGVRIGDIISTQYFDEYIYKNNDLDKVMERAMLEVL